ncbi:hypothetical protein [Arthrobacter psychrolactophilus]
MSYKITVKALSGAHLAQRITIRTGHTEATCVLQGLRHDVTALKADNLMRDEWVTGRRETTITLLPKSLRDVTQS